MKITHLYITIIQDEGSDFKAREVGRVEGRKEGRVEGREEGRVEGREESSHARLALLGGGLFSLSI